ncbi:hypothetical protein A2867_05375 [Candidatus Daviesbacteria bacterium RIFCSPHIGHO2_01_FULL_40_11]|uniref:Uncharacterized protein n=1 Tax=Candidatus Daviesbacteria bacterium RIFCSPHIGHO2_01_FULL_40_11 TaxID=1797762 RepID=A0A1F5JKZ7_9BACT|nr:MAG: hypothetical protein A2867_05375 [Candidatus Daviesbacteria bacterium RIFCSPHIGHO2_01_FULL_40_11]OGE63139.1 MAG: hypothetical protein A2964_00860 [Candidatus Daviesbacteria bacterium RIFCSPLOWO2_01_FULL_40_27]
MSTFVFLGLLLYSLFFIQPVFAIVNPLSVPNNKFGIHIIQATPDESSPAAKLVNTNGDWGYITVLVESKDRDHNKWQEFFDDLRRRHLIPLVRLATEPQGNFWKRPYEKEEEAWADFLDALNWPTKNRYVIVYNEPNHGTEWGNKVDASSYAEVLDKTITALKNKNQDFFVLNGGFDASTPSKPPVYEDQITFMKEMNKAVPGIFEKLDGWVSHSYPNPAFAGSPAAVGRGTVRNWFWEIQQLRNLGVTYNLPVFITETGWKHAEGLSYDSRLPDEETVAKYYKEAFETAWNIDRIVAITPFLLSYQEIPFDHFSFKKPTGEKQNIKVLSVAYPEYYSMYQTIQDLPKVTGKPVQETKALLTKGEIYSSIISGEIYTISLTFKNIGQSIWNDRQAVMLQPIEGGQSLGITGIELPEDRKIEPGQEYTFNLNLKAPQSGTYKVSLNLFDGSSQFDSKPVEFTTEVKSPVVLKILSTLGWKKDFAGAYVLRIKGISEESAQAITLNTEGVSPEIEARYLLPDYSFEFSLEKPFYKPKTINQKVSAGVNTLDFGVLQPDIFTAILHPKELWKLLPFSN